MSNESRSLIDRLFNENMEWCKQEKSQDSLRIIRDNIFDEKTHFILELLQNADDCSSTEISFELHSDRLIVRNNGKPFSSENVIALSNIGRSTKGEDHIGYFGIGFKSVFQVTDFPEVHSGHYHFRYDSENLIAPHWISDPEHISPESGTIFAFPLLDNAQIFENINQQLDSFTGDVLLFLRSLRRIVLRDTVFELRPNAASTFTLYKNDEKNSHWKRYSAILPIPEEIQVTIQTDRGRRWSKKRLEEISISFQVDDDGSPLPDQKGRLFAFFPTAVFSGLQFNIQADFLVPLSRTTLQNPSGKWNQWIFQNVFHPVSKMIVDSKNHGFLRTRFYELLPQKGKLNQNYLEPVKKGIDNYFEQNETVLTASRKWITPTDAQIPKLGIRELLDERHLGTFFYKKNHYISEEISEKSILYLKEHVSELTFDHLFSHVFTDVAWLSKRPLRWFIKLYSFLWDWLSEKDSWERRESLEKIRKTSIFPTDSEKMSPAKEGHRKLYRLGNQQLPFASLLQRDYEILSGQILKRVAPDSNRSAEGAIEAEKAQQLIAEAIPLINVQQILNDLIYPAFQKWETKSDSLLIRYTDFVRRFVDKPEKDRIVIKRHGESKKYEKPSQLLIPSEYGADPLVGSLFNTASAPYVSPTYVSHLLKMNTQKAQDEIHSWKLFFRRLGCYEYPPLIKSSKVINSSDLLKEIEKYSGKKSIHESNRGYKITDFDLNYYFIRILTDINQDNSPDNIAKSKLTLHIFDKNWEYYRHYIDCIYHHHVYGAQVWSDEKLRPSSFANRVRETAWVPCISGKILKPSHVFLNLPEIREIMGDKVEYVDGTVSNQGLIKYARFNTKPSSSAMLSHLRGLIDRKSKAYESFRRCYYFLLDYLSDSKVTFKEKEEIRKAFKVEPLIFVPNASSNIYRRSDEVVLSSPAFLTEYKPNLETYFGLDRFFVEFLGVLPELTMHDYINFIIKLSENSDLSFAQQESLISAYSKIDSALADDEKGKLSGEKRSRKIKEIAQKFRSKGRVWCVDKTWATLSDSIYFDDNENLFRLFRNSGVKIIYLDQRKRARLPVHFLREFQIKSLKESAQELSNDIESYILRDGTEEELIRIRTLVPYIRGFIKLSDPELFRSVGKDEIFKKLSCCEMKIASGLETFYQVGSVRILNDDRKGAYYDKARNCLYIVGGVKDREDDISLVFSEILGDPPGLIDFISRLIGLDEIERQSIIGRRKIEWVEVKTEPDSTSRKIDPTTGGDRGEQKSQAQKLQRQTGSGTSHSAAPKPRFDADAYVKEIEPDLDSIVVFHLSEDALQNVGSDSKISSGTGTGGIWSGMSDEQRKQIGNAAEKIVLRLEIKRLRELFQKGILKSELFQKIDYVAERNDSAGFDILSWDEDELPLYIEVKGSSDPDSMDFPISREEFRKAEEKGERYLIYRVCNVRQGAQPKIAVLRNPFALWRKNKLRIVSKQLLMSAKIN